MTLLLTALCLYLFSSLVQMLFKNTSVRYYFILVSSFICACLAGVPAFKAVRSLSSDYINFAAGKINFTFVLDNIAAPIILFSSIAVFLIVLNCKKYFLESGKNDIALCGISVTAFFALLCSVNAALFCLYLDVMLLSFLFLCKAAKKYFILSQIGLLLIAAAFVFIFKQSGTIEFGRLYGAISPYAFALILIGSLACVSAAFTAYKKECNFNMPLLLFSSVGITSIGYILVRFLFLWQRPEEFITYIILVTGFFIAYRGVLSANTGNSTDRIWNLSCKNFGLMLVALAVSMFGIILRHLPTMASALFAVYFFMFNQIIGIPALLISAVTSEEAAPINSWQRFLPSNKIYSGILLFTLFSLPPMSAFAAYALLFNSILAGFEIKNIVFAILLLLSLVLCVVIEIFSVRSGAEILQNITAGGSDRIYRFFRIGGFVLILLFAGLFPHIAVEFFVAPVFVFCGGNLYVPQVMLSNISLINISFVMMFLGVYLLKILFVRGNK